MEEFVEIEEHFKDGLMTKRLVNGVEYPVDTFPELDILSYKGVSLKQIMPYKEAVEKYGNMHGSIGTC